MFKNLLFSLLYFFIGILIINLFLTVFSYFNLIGDNVINVLYFFFPLGLVLICSYLLGKKSEKKGRRGRREKRKLIEEGKKSVKRVYKK